MYKKCNVVMLAIEDTKNGLLIEWNNKLSFNNNRQDSMIKNKHLYIISDDKIEENNWITDGKRLFYMPVLLDGYINLCKVIASTDPALNLRCNHCGAIKELATGMCVKCGKFPTNSFPSIPQSFIDKYISEYNKGNKIDEVMVEYDEKLDKSNGVGSEYFYTLKLNSDNNINIQSIKDSWTREEVIDLIHFFRCDILEEVEKEGKVVNFTDKWIETNL